MSTMPLPPSLSWPECLECKQPVTERQQACQMYALINGKGLVHKRCMAFVMVRFERAMIEVTP